MLQRAVNYFTNGKIACKDFDTAVKLQRQGGCRNLVTLDGTEFKQGMISSGQPSQNAFDLKLGQGELEKDIKRL